jgi:hypothetical protein
MRADARQFAVAALKGLILAAKTDRPLSEYIGNIRNPGREYPGNHYNGHRERVPRKRERVISNGFIETDPAPAARHAPSSSSGSVPIKS